MSAGTNLLELSDGQVWSAGKEVMMRAPVKHPGWASEAVLPVGMARSGSLGEASGQGYAQIGLVPSHSKDHPTVSTFGSPPISKVSPRGIWKALGEGYPWLCPTRDIPVPNPCSLGSCSS